MKCIIIIQKNKVHVADAVFVVLWTYITHGKVKPVFVLHFSLIPAVTCELSSEPLPIFASFRNQALLAVRNITVQRVTKIHTPTITMHCLQHHV